MVTAVSRLAEQEHSAALAQLGSRISAIMKFGAGADDDPFVKVKDLVMELISMLQAKALSEANQKSYCDEETSKTTEKKEDLEADVAKHSSKLEAAVARSIALDGEISTLQSELSVLLNRQLQMDIMCAVERYILARVTSDIDRHRVQQRNVEQTINTLATSIAEMIGEVPVIQTQGKTQQGVNTHVQRVVNTNEVETPKIVKEAVRGKKVIREKSTGLPSTSRIRRFSSRTRLMKCQSLCKDKTPWSRLFRRPKTFHSCGVLTRWLVSLLSKFQGSRSWRRQPKSHSCRLLRKLLKPHRPR